MPRQAIALSLPSPLPPLPTVPHPAASPLQTTISTTLSSTDYDAVCVPLTNPRWQERWDRLCLRPADDEGLSPAEIEAKELERELVDREADVWRRDGGLKRDEVNVSRLEETQHLIGVAAEWLELDSPDEGIRFDSELVSRSVDDSVFGLQLHSRSSGLMSEG
jgi:protein arginine N-methyltransferase 5